MLHTRSFRISLLAGSIALGCAATPEDSSEDRFRACEALVDGAFEAETDALPDLTARMADEGCYDQDLLDELVVRLIAGLEPPADTDEVMDLMQATENLRAAAPSDVVFRGEGQEVEENGCSDDGKVCILTVNGGGDCDPPVQVGETTFIVCGNE